MPTLGEACRQLRISRHTLDKWLTRLEIQPTRHPFDYRHFTITDADVDAIRAARAQMPGLPASGQNAPVRRSEPNLTAQGGRADTFPIQRPRKTPVKASGALPDGWMNQKRAADAHGIAYQTLREWCRKGIVETDPGEYPTGHGHWEPKRPITQRGLAQLVAYARVHQPHRFHVCDDCPHAAASDPDGAETPTSGQE